MDTAASGGHRLTHRFAPGPVMREDRGSSAARSAVARSGGGPPAVGGVPEIGSEERMGKIATLTAVGVGYVLGARAGRGRYEQIAARARGVWGDPRVQRAAADARSAAAEKAPLLKDTLRQAGSAGSRSTGGPGTA